MKWETRRNEMNVPVSGALFNSNHSSHIKDSCLDSMTKILSHLWRLQMESLIGPQGKKNSIFSEIFILKMLYELWCKFITSLGQSWWLSEVSMRVLLCVCVCKWNALWLGNFFHSILNYWWTCQNQKASEKLIFIYIRN